MPAEESSELASLREENRALSEQLKRLVKTESRLYRTQRELDEQLKRINLLNLFALAAGQVSDPSEILARAGDALITMFPFEQVLGVSCGADGRAELRAARSVPGREAQSGNWPTGFVLDDEERAALAEPRLLASERLAARPAPLERLLACSDEVFAGGGAPVAALVLPLWRRRVLIGVLVARRITPSTTYHAPLPGERELAFLQLFGHHAENAVENATLMKDLADFAADLEARVRARTAELGEVNRRLDANLAELRATQDQLVLTGKLAAIGTLVAGLSHELNNPIGVILGAAQVLIERTDVGAPAKRSLEVIERQARRCARLVEALLDFSRKREPIREVQEPAALLERVNELASGLAGRRLVQLTFEPSPELPRLQVCATEIESALLNLISNAFDASSDGGSIEVRAKPAARAGKNGVAFSVRDRGRGIPAEVLPRIFDPFFTTKPVGQGTGLGLSLTRKIVDAHGGRLEIDTELGRGTTISIWLPAAGTEAETP
jgi:signal transduction histidine kinase